MENVISISKLKSNDLLEHLRFLWFADRKALQNAFAKRGVLIDSEKDLISLRDFNKKGDDVRGSFKNRKGEKVVFNVRDVVDNEIQVRHHVLDSNQYKMKLVA